MSDLRKMYTLAELSKLTKLSNRSLRRFVKNGILKGVKNGKNWGFTFDEVVEFFYSPITSNILKIKFASRVKKFAFEEVSNVDRSLFLFELRDIEKVLLDAIFEYIPSYESEYGVEILFFVRDGVPQIFCLGKSKSVAEAMEDFRSKRYLKPILEKMREE